MNSDQRRKKTIVEELVDLAISRGVVPEDLAPHVMRLGKIVGVTGVEHAKQITAAGLTAQITFLSATIKESGTRKLINNLGSVLDGFVMGYSSDPEDMRRMIGKDRVNGNGHII